MLNFCYNNHYLSNNECQHFANVSNIDNEPDFQEAVDLVYHNIFKFLIKFDGLS